MVWETDMKKFALFVVFVTIGVTLFGVERGTLLSLMGTHSGTGKVTELEVIHDLHGGAYILYIDDGEFHALRGTDAAGLTPYEPKGFDRHPKQARSLRSFEGVSEQYTAFIGSEGNREELFLFGVNYKGELVYYPLRESETAGTISGYFLSCVRPDVFQIYILSEGQLYCLSGDESPQTMKRGYPVSLPGEKVREFEIVSQPGQDGAMGWYTALADGLCELNLFSMEENGFLTRESAGTFHIPPKVIAGEDAWEGAVYKIINGNDISVYRGRKTGFSKEFSFKSPGAVKNYFTINGSDAEIGLLLIEAGDVDAVYLVSNETVSAPALEPLFVMEKDSLWNLSLLTLPSNEKGQAGGFDHDQICFFSNFDGRPRFSIIGLRSGIRRIGGLPELKDPAVFCCTGISDTLKVCVLNLRENPSLLIYRYDQDRWTLERVIAIPTEIGNKNWLPETALVLNPFYMESDIVSLIAEDMLFLCDFERNIYQVLEKRKHCWSRKINDIIFAVLAGEDGLELYRMGADL
jgi:hypothetical protein